VKTIMMAVIGLSFCISCHGDYRGVRRYQIRYDETSAQPSAVSQGVEFTIGGRVGNLPCYAYIHYDSIDGHIRLLSKKTANTMYTLDMKDLDRLYAIYGTDGKLRYGTSRILIAADKIQKSEIIGIHNELISQHPELFPNGKELKYGVVQDANWDCVLDKTGKIIPDSSVFDYQQGKTIILPVAYAPSMPARLTLNLNSPAVKEYCVRRALSVMQKNKTNCLFIDNTSWTTAHTYAATLHYMGSGTVNQQIIGYTNALDYICRQIKTRASPAPSILTNGLVVWCPEQKLFLDTFTDSLYIDGMMCENAFANKAYFYDIDGWMKWIDKFRMSNKKLLFCADSSTGITSDYNDAFANKLWLWLNLIGNGNVYVYISEDYTKPPRNYSFYDQSLGNPLEDKPQKQGNVWKRRYQGGLISFDMSAKNLSLTKLAPNQ
jgi:Hypothetical glycosyl hydrolase family 15